MTALPLRRRSVIAMILIQTQISWIENSDYLQMTCPTSPRNVEDICPTGPHIGIAKYGIRSYLTAQLRVDAVIELQLLILTISIGIQDAIAFPDFKCFVSNQTGNTVVLALGVAGLGGNQFSLANVGISLGAFVTGAFITGQIANTVGSYRRDWLLFTHMAQTLMVFGAAAIQGVKGELAVGSGPWAMGSIALLAFSSGAQVASMRPMRIQEITTAMATAAWVDFVIDPKLLAACNRSRDRRALFLVTLIAGSFMGALMYKSVGPAYTLVLSAAVKLLVTFTLLLNRERNQ
ncbi:hypothetical protein DM02DRAFT_691000 [Periconia macrospinosa]|uniref:DUF1275 domain protein n=1 Tax=Periconia macrospinosa TaxID=97972 RepID=A0A2V1DCL9_9PLEO|nr:hypothetical protein DM02DRAFT_691000 [Periconia macrospinosa]